ncbi:MAG: SUMF1/EgtB/PvdO family nonheme iron enzyme [Myxococcales bacterium]|nr:SUMF1/EgtB/PvdO family nonheme iron enzyme [Myxococcales bacterium]
MPSSVRALFPGHCGEAEVRALLTLDGCAVTYRARLHGEEIRLTVAQASLGGDPRDAVERARRALPEGLRVGTIECDDGAHLWLAEPLRAPFALGGPRSPAEAWAHLRAAAAELGALHAEGRCHGAFSPASLGEFTLVDRARVDLGLVAVDPLFAAPEQLEARLGPVGPRTDVFALGAVFFQLVRGSAPHEGLQPGDRCTALLDRRARPSLRAAGLPVATAIDAVLARMLAVDPDARYPDAHAAYAALGEAVLSSPEPGGQQRALPRFSFAPVEAPREPRRAPADPKIVAAACVGIILVAFSGEAILARRATATLATAPTNSAIPMEPEPVAAPPPTISSATPKVTATASASGPDLRALLADVVPVPKEAPRFLLDRTEVPVQLYAACVAAGACTTTRKRGTGYRADDPLRREWLCNLHREGRADHPINCVSRVQAAAFCKWAGKRLPTDAEWTLAVGQKQFPWGDGGLRCDRAVFARYGPDQGGCRKQPVGTMPVEAHPDGAGPYGNLELAGSLWEWVSSPSEHGFGLLRGGAWDGNEHVLGKAGRLEQTIDNADVTLGVRCARDP